MLHWVRTADGWAVNLDGTSAASAFALPRVELHAGERGWRCVCHLPNGTSRERALAAAGTIVTAKRAALEDALSSLGPAYERQVRALLDDAPA